MGSRPNAYLFYGVVLDEDSCEHRNGWEIIQCIEENGGDILTSYAQGYHDEPSAILAIKETMFTTDWDYQITVPIDDMKTKHEEWDTKIVEFCIEHDLKHEKPRWQLAASYG